MRIAMLMLGVLALCVGCATLKHPELVHRDDIQVHPSGEEISPGHQIVVTFNEPVAGLGDPFRNADEPPISVSPSVACEWRWVDARSLACGMAYEDRLRYATEYEVGVDLEQLGLSDSPVVHVERFSTLRPAAEFVWSATWESPVRPAFEVAFNQPVDDRSLQAHMVMRVEGLEDVPVIAEQIEDPDSPWDHQTRRIIRPARDLPAGADIELIILRGLTGAEGPLASLPEADAIKRTRTHVAFELLGGLCPSDPYGEHPIEQASLSFHITGCEMGQDVALVFSAPPDDIDESNLKARLVDGEGSVEIGLNGYYRSVELAEPAGEEGGRPVWLVELSGIQHGSRHALDLTGVELKDKFGRKISELDREIIFNAPDAAPTFGAPQLIAIAPGRTGLPGMETVNISDLSATTRVATRGGVQSIHETLFTDADIDNRMRLSVPKQGLAGIERSGYGIVDFESSEFEELSAGWRNPTMGVISSPVNVLSISMSDGIHVWLLRWGDARPVAGEAVSLIETDRDGVGGPWEELATGTTDADGYVRFPSLRSLATEDADRSEWGLPVVRSDTAEGVVHVPLDMPNRHGGRSADRRAWPGLAHRPDPPGMPLVWFMTDKGIYRPGETVRFRAWSRRDVDGRLKRSASTRVQVAVGDWQTTVSSFGLEFDERGRAVGEFIIPDSTRSGEYRFDLASDEESSHWAYGIGSIVVSDFRPRALDVRLHTDVESATTGDAIPLRITAETFSGRPRVNADASVSYRFAERDIGDLFANHEGFSFGIESGFWRQRDSYPDQTPSMFIDDLRTGDDGVVRVDLVVPELDTPAGQLMVSADVSDENGDRVFSSASTIPVLGRDRFIGLSMPRRWIEAGESLSPQVVVLDGDERRIVGETVTLRLQEDTAPRWQEEDWETVQECSVETAGVPVTCHLSASTGGRMRVLATGEDTAGRLVEAAVPLWVLSSVNSTPESNAEVVVLSERNRYAVGEIAPYLINAPFRSARVLVRLHRDSTIEQRWLRLTDGEARFELSMQHIHAPGFDMDVHVFSSDEGQELELPLYGTTSQRVQVDAEEQVPLRLSAGNRNYRPGDRVELKVHHMGDRDHGSVEVALTVMDGAVLSLLRGEESFFDPGDELDEVLLSWTSPDSDALAEMLLRAVRNRSLGDARELERIEVTGSRMKRSDLFQSDETPAGSILRSRFTDVAHWAPDLLIQPGESRTLSFELPDNLTRWMVVALSVDALGHVSLQTLPIPTEKQVELDITGPTHATQGDIVELTASVANRDERERVLETGFQVRGGEILGTGSSTVDLTPDEVGIVLARVRVDGPGSLEVRSVARDEFGGDGMSLSIPIVPRTAVERMAQFGSLSGSEATIPLDPPPDSLENRLDLVLAPSLAGGLGGALDYMRDYPHACWEQSISRAIVAANQATFGERVAEGEGWKNPWQEVQSVMRAMPDYQKADGGMGYWIDSDYSSNYLSVFTLLAQDWILDKFRASNPEKSDDAIGTTHDYYDLESLVESVFVEDHHSGASSIGWNPDLRAMAVRVLANDRWAVDWEDVENLIESRESMSDTGRLHLTHAIIDGHPEQREALALLWAEFRSNLQITAGQFRWGASPEGRGIPDFVDTATRSCMLLDTVVGLHELGITDDGDVLRAVRGSLLSAEERGHWGTTHANAFCVQALGNYITAFEASEGATHAQALLDGMRIAAPSFDGPGESPVRVNQALSGEASELVLERDETGGPLIYRAGLSVERDAFDLEPASAGLSIDRRIEVMREGMWSDAKVDSLKVGDLVKVSLIVESPAAQQFVAVTDPVPGALRSLNKDLADAEMLRILETGDETDSWWAPFGSPDHAGHIVRFYADFLPAGIHELSYHAQVVAAGEYTALAPKVEGMYDPDVYGRGRTQRFTVTRSRD